MVGSAISLIFGGSLALLAGGGAHAVTKSHYQKRLRELEVKLRDLRLNLEQRESELEATRAELETLRTRLEDRERRLSELDASVAALRDLAVNLDRRLQAHGTLMRRTLATLTLRRSDHRREGDILQRRLVKTQRTLESFNQGETDLQTEIVSLRDGIGEHLRAVEEAEEQLRRSLSEHQVCENEIREAVST
jgi:chromosome segregation ATPase